MRTTIHWNIVQAIFQHNQICQDCWKNTRSEFECMVFLKSRRHGQKRWRTTGQIGPVFSTRILTLSPGLENNHTFKCWYVIFPTIRTYMIMLENCQNNISVYGCSPIQGIFFCYCWRLKFCPQDLRTTIHWNVVQAIFQHNQICQDCWKNNRSAFECMVFLKSRGHGQKRWRTTGQIGPVFSTRIWTLSPGLENNHTFKCWYVIFSNNIDIYDYVGKLSEQHFSVWLFSNPGDFFFIIVEV